MNGVLDNVKIGDKIIKTTRLGTSILTVEKVHKNFIIAGGCKFRKADGSLVTNDRWCSISATPATDEALLAYAKAVNRQKMIAKCRDTKFEKLSDSQLKQIVNIINIQTI